MKMPILILLTAFASAQLPAAEIHDAAGSGDTAKVTALLKENPKRVHEKDELGNLPLHHAAQGDSSAVSLALIEAGADVNAQDEDGYTPLHHAAEERQLRQVALLLKHGAKPDLASAAGATPFLISAMYGGNIEIMDLLLKAGAKPGALTDFSPALRTAL